MRGEQEVAKIGALEGTANDLHEVHDAHKRTALALDEKVALVRRTTAAMEVPEVCLSRPRRIRVVAMKRATPASGREELGLESPGGSMQVDPGGQSNTLRVAA
jgi:hypothetical protein